ncbi:hypothetical protein HWV62_12604 [Athelia sp. TMB]|nr:hypothetical protein HWV62_12604 [Athelia sp. TMB]
MSIRGNRAGGNVLRGSRGGERGQRGGERGGRGDRGGRGGPVGRGVPGSGGTGRGRDSPHSEVSRRGGFQGQGNRGGGGRGPPRGGPTFGGGPRGGRGGGGGGFRGGGPPQSNAPLIFAENRPAQIDARLADPGLNRLVASFKDLAVKNDKVLRPGFGTLGKAITLRANFFAVRVPKGPIYEYRVAMNPKADVKNIRARLFDLLENSAQCAPHMGYIAHDRSERLVSKKELPQPLDITIPFYDEGLSGPQPGGSVYTVSIEYSGTLDPDELNRFQEGKSALDYDPLPIISALNLVLQTHASKTGVRVGQNQIRHFFKSPNEQPISLSLRVEAWKGFFSSVRPTYKQLMVNVNVAMAAFYVPGNLADAVMAFERNSAGGMPHRFTKGLKVRVIHLGYKKPLKSICGSARQQTFKHDVYDVISVEEYFKKAHNITLRHPNLPVFDVSGPNSKRPTYIPAELCEIEHGESYRNKLDGDETANMIKYAAQRPGVNADAIVNRGPRTLGLNEPVSPISGFGITISPEMAAIPARQLPAPSLNYKVGRANIRDGGWNILDVKFHRGAVVDTWWVMVVRDGPQSMIQAPNDPRLTKLIQGFKRKCLSSGMQVRSDARLVAVMLDNPKVDPNRKSSIDKIRQVIKENIAADKGKKPSFILVLLSNIDNFIYPGIKRIGDVEIGVHTVHMQLKKALLEQKQDQYFSNVALKLNTKLGGMNHLLDAVSMKWLTSKKTMIVGMDVTHPGPSSVEGTPSIAAVVASVDDSFVQFPASMRPQKSKEEMIQELEEMMVERLTVYQKFNKRFPDRVYVYRDGVSEGQYDLVFKHELPQMLEAFKKVSPRTVYRPKLSIIICGKRHHARFYPTTSTEADKNGNTKPGTVVDKGVTEVFGFDWYLQAHAGLQGTVRPTHYTVIYDENKLGADEVQQGTHTASYLYARATKAVSLVPAAYYADLACERGRFYINEFLNLADDKTDTESVATGSGGPRQTKGKIDKEAKKKMVYDSAVAMWGQGLHDSIKDTMFYI